MELNDDQKRAVQSWVEAGLGLSEIQKKLTSEFGFTLTYMEVRLLILDLGLTVKDRRPTHSVLTSPPNVTAAEGQSASASEESAWEPEEESEGEDDLGKGTSFASAVKVQLSRLARPGALVSGTVTFRDGVRAEWWLDQFGRLGLDPGSRNYRPSPQDLQEFQSELRRVLQSHGF